MQNNSIKYSYLSRNNFLLILRVFISFIKQLFTFRSNRVKCKMCLYKNTFKVFSYTSILASVMFVLYREVLVV